MTFVLVVVETYVAIVRTIDEPSDIFCREWVREDFLYFIQLKIKHLQADMNSNP
jgi:hypothetical protein